VGSAVLKNPENSGLLFEVIKANIMTMALMVYLHKRWYGVATINRLLKMIGLFCRIYSSIGLFCKRDL